jgi:hypothetical protein
MPNRSALAVPALLSLFLVLFPVKAMPYTIAVDYVKISDSQGGFTGSLDDRDSFGVSSTALGDIDGDGIVDLAVGASRDDDGASDAGAVWILFLKADGTVKSHQKISLTQGGFSGELDYEDFFGSYVASMGDRDGDGVGDLAVGAIFDDDGGPDRGALWLIDLNPDGTVKGNQKISAEAGGFTGSLNDGDQFGASAAAIGDVDGDGVGDLAVGSREDGDGGAGAGAVWILFLNIDGTVKSHQKISDTRGGLGGGLLPGDRFGMSTAPLGDMSGDGVPDLAVGAYQDDDGGTNRGAVWILFLNTDGTVMSHRKISDTQGGFEGILDNYDVFGKSVANMGDVNGDGTLDLAVGAIGDDDGDVERGAAWLLFLNSDGTVKTYQKFSDLEGGLQGALGTSNYFGSSVTSLGDLDGNGTIDLAVGAHYDDGGGHQRGAVWNLFLEVVDVDRLVIGNGTGLPRGGSFPVPVSLTNINRARGLQFTIRDVPEAVTVTDVIPVGRAAGMTASFADRGGDAEIVLYGLEGEGIPVGAGAVVNLMVEIHAPLDLGGEVVLQGVGALLSHDGATVEIPVVGGFVIAGRRSGDVNGDNRVDVGDVIRLVEIILGTGKVPNPGELSEADCTGDTEINIGDITCLVDHILNGPTNPAAISTGMTPLTIANDTEVRGFQLAVTGAVEEAQDLTPFVFHITSRASGTTVMAFDPAGKGWPKGTRTPLLTDAPLAEVAQRFHAYGPGGVPLTVTVSAEGIRVGNTGTGVTPQLHMHAGLPNPFHSGTTIRFSTDGPGEARAIVYDVQGKRVKVLPERQVEAGEHSWPWTAVDETGHRLPAGIYLAMVEFEGQRASVRLTHLGP